MHASLIYDLYTILKKQNGTKAEIVFMRKETEVVSIGGNS
jgi:hypothetical protein